MYTARRSPRESVQLPAYLELPRRSGGIVRVPAQTRDLSDEGVGLWSLTNLIPGLPVAIVVEEPGEAQRRQRRWRGRVVYERETSYGQHLGIAFDAPELGPSLSLSVARKGGGERRFRLDGPALNAASASAPAPAQDGVDPALVEHGIRLFRGLALAGITIDQLLKGLCARNWVELTALSPAQAASSPWVELVPTLVALSSAGLIARLAEKEDVAARPVTAMGMGLLLGGLLSTVLDRLAFHGIRELTFLPMSPAEFFTISGAALALGSMALRQTTALLSTEKPQALAGTSR